MGFAKTLLGSMCFLYAHSFSFAQAVWTQRPDTKTPTSIDCRGCALPPEVFLAACSGDWKDHEWKNEMKNTCEWEKKCMSASHPDLAGKGIGAIASACEEEHNRLGATFKEYPDFHFDAKSWQNTAPMSDRQGGNAERIFRAECKVRSPESLARGMYGCIEFSVEARQWNEQVKRMYIDKFRNLWGEIKASKFVDEIVPANPLPSRFHRPPQ